MLKGRNSLDGGSTRVGRHFPELSGVIILCHGQTARRFPAGAVVASELPSVIHQLLRFLDTLCVVQRPNELWVLLKEELGLPFGR
ncbi:hypothetical protein D3C87_1618960 [compost metagenome]